MTNAHAIVERAMPSISPLVCTTHCMNLFFQDITSIADIREVINDARAVSIWCLSHHAVRAALRKACVEHLGHDLTPIVGNDVRFGVHFIGLHRLNRLKECLKMMIAFPGIEADADDSGKEAINIIRRETFWYDVVCIIQMLWPAMCFLRLCDSDEPTMGLIVHVWKRVRRALREMKAKLEKEEEDEDGSGCKPIDSVITVRLLEELLALYDTRLAGNFRPIHFAAYLLCPRLWDVSTMAMSDAVDGFMEFAGKIFYHEEDR